MPKDYLDFLPACLPSVVYFCKGRHTVWRVTKDENGAPAGSRRSICRGDIIACMVHSLDKPRLQRLVVLGLTILVFGVLAAGISNVKPRAGEIVFAPREERVIPERETPRDTTPVVRDIDRGNPWYYLFSFAGIAVAVYAIWRYPRVRYGVLVLFLFTAFVLTMIYLYRLFYVPPPQDSTDAVFASQPLPERPDEELFNNPPDWIGTVSVVVTAVILLATSLVVWLALYLRHRRKPPLEIVSLEAEAALADLYAGVEVKDAVTRCYVDMSRALARQRGIARQQGMTPREFESVLVEEGLPPQSVTRLTRLFERVRYGGQEASERERQEAIAALEEIVAAVKGE